MKKLWCLLIIFLLIGCGIKPGLAPAPEFRMTDKDEKATLVAADMVMIEDSEDGNDTKHTTVDAFDTYLSSIYQPLTAYLTDLADGTITSNFVNTTYPWVDNEVDSDLTLDLLRLTIKTSAPDTPEVDRWYIADNLTWDPCDMPGEGSYYCICTNATAPEYIALLEGGNLKIASIELPSYTHFATGDAVYDDNTTAHVLTVQEMKNSIITNAGASEDKVYTCPAAEFGMNGMGMVIAAYQMDFEPDGNETLWLNGVQMAAGEHIQNTADTKGDVIAFWSVESGDGTYEIFFKSDNANWVEATP